MQIDIIQNEVYQYASVGVIFLIGSTFYNTAPFQVGKKANTSLET